MSDITVVAMDGLYHELESGIDDGSGLSGVEVFNQGGRAFDISEDGGDGLWFTLEDGPSFQRLFLGQDALG